MVGLSWTSVLLVGLSVGLTTCALSCLPFLGAWSFGGAGGSSEAARHTGLFIAGRVAAYTLLGGVAGAFGGTLDRLLSSGASHLALGTVSVAAGLALVRRGLGPASCATPRSARLPPLLLGLTMALTPCAPLASLLGACAVAGSGTGGASLGLAFGLGAAVTPVLLVAPALGAIGRRLVDERAGLGRWLRVGGAAVLVWLGVNRLWLASELIRAPELTRSVAGGTR